MFEHIPITTVTKQIASIAAAANDSTTTTVAAGAYVELYGSTFGTAEPSAAVGAELTITVGSTVVTRFTLFLAALGGGGSSSMLFPAGTYYQGALGEDLIVKVENVGAGNMTETTTTVFYRVITPK